jgi:hypothetical protein
MILPAVSYLCLAEALILFPVSTLTIKKIYNGSKSYFGYLLIAFTFADAINRVATFLINCFPNKRSLRPNQYAGLTN